MKLFLLTNTICAYEIHLNYLKTIFWKLSFICIHLIIKQYNSTKPSKWSVYVVHSFLDLILTTGKFENLAFSFLKIMEK